MAVTAFATGTLTATAGGTEDFLSSPDEAGAYTLHVDTNNMVAGDVIELRVYQKVLTGGTVRVAYLQRYFDAQPTDDKIKISVPISNDLVESNALRFSLTQTKGSARQFPWKVLKHS